MPTADEYRRQIILSASVVGHAEFRRRSFLVRDFLDQIEKTDSATLVGAKIIAHFCVEDGRFNGFLPGIQLAILFLNQYLNKPGQMEAALKDLRKLLDSSPSVEGIHQWIESYYC
jgi:hypothetical protein